MRQVSPPMLTVLVVLDGLGHSSATHGNAVVAARMPFFKGLLTEYPSTVLTASGSVVGLLPDMAGNSQVGHVTLGAGRVVKSSIVRFHELVDSGAIFTHPVSEKMKLFAATKKTLHVLGLLSDGGVHSHQFHLHGVIAMAVRVGVQKIVVHPILDGRDVAPISAEGYLEKLENFLKERGCGEIGSLQGRFYAMDRDKNWNRTIQSYKMMCGNFGASNISWREALERAYVAGATDEFIEPVLLAAGIALQNGDAFVFVNVRPDRACQLTELFLSHETQVRQGVQQRDLALVVTGYRYAKNFDNPVFLEPFEVQDTLLDVVEKAYPHCPIFLVAETEKYAHVTYFFKGMRDEVVPQEKRVMVPSLKMKNYSDQPAMSASEITNTVCTLIDENTEAFFVVNYANADMVGHSGNFDATVRACEILDEELKKLAENIARVGGLLCITADHGNAEEMLDVAGQPKTSHTKNPVLFVLVAPSLKGTSFDVSKDLGLARVAPTILQFLGLSKPSAMTDQLSILAAEK